MRQSIGFVAVPVLIAGAVMLLPGAATAPSGALPKAFSVASMEDLESVSKAFIEDNASVSDRVLRVTEDKFSDVFARFEVDPIGESYEVGYYEKAEPNRITAFKDELSRIVDEFGYPLTYTPRPYLNSAILAASDEIAANSAEWNRAFGSSSFILRPDADGRGSLVVSTDVGRVGDGLFTVAGVPVVVADEPEEIRLESRWDDSSPWAAGIWLTSSPSLGASGFCTAGYAWRLWSTNQVYGSTAAHCIVLGGVTTYYNYGAHVGTSAIVSTPYDTALLAPASGTAFGSNVYVGSKYATTAYPVVGASTLGVGSIVAFGGGSANGVSPPVKVLETNLIQCYAVSSTENRCVFGVSRVQKVTGPSDSGGPWLTSNSTGGQYAHGQHYGSTPVHSFFVDINKISGGLEATLVTAP